MALRYAIFSFNSIVVTGASEGIGRGYAHEVGKLPYCCLVLMLFCATVGSARSECCADEPVTGKAAESCR